MFVILQLFRYSSSLLVKTRRPGPELFVSVALFPPQKHFPNSLKTRQCGLFAGGDGCSVTGRRGAGLPPPAADSPLVTVQQLCLPRTHSPPLAVALWWSVQRHVKTHWFALEVQPSSPAAQQATTLCPIATGSHPQ